MQKRKDDWWKAGTSTLIGGVLVQLGNEVEGGEGGGRGGEEGERKGGLKWRDLGMVKKKKSEKRGVGAGREWAFVCVNVGDCKAILYSRKKQEFFDITRGNR